MNQLEYSYDAFNCTCKCHNDNGTFNWMNPMSTFCGRCIPAHTKHQPEESRSGINCK